MIPKIIHQFWAEGPVPEHFHKWQQTWKDHNPDFEYILWDYEKAEQFIIDHYWYLHRFWKDLKFKIQQYDFVRYLWLDYYGGFYADMDVECLKPLHPLLNEEIVLCPTSPTDPRICNAMMGSTRGHYYWISLVSEIIDKYTVTMKRNHSDVKKVLRSTGPDRLTTCWNHLPFKFTLHPHYVFYPFDYKRLDLKDEHFPNSYTKHYWEASWKPQ